MDDWIRVADSRAVADAPTSVTAAGQRIALVRLTPGGPVRAFADHCPHRLVPLSAGTVVDGRLRCAYHGWEFGDSGRCELLPSAGPEAAGPPRSALTPIPVREDGGGVYVAPGAPEPEPSLLTNLHPALARAWHPVALAAELEAPVHARLLGRDWWVSRVDGQLRADPVPAGLRERWGLVWLAPEAPLTDLFPDPDTEDAQYVGGWLPPARTNVSAGVVADNFLDVAHFPFVHAGTFGAGEATTVQPYEVVDEPDGCRSVQEQWFDNPGDPGVAAGIRPVRQRRRATYVYRAPFQLLLRLAELDAGAVKTILFFAQPEDLHSTRIYTKMLLRDIGGVRDPRPATLAAEIAFEEAVLAEDLALQRSMVLPGLPLRPRDELHVRADRLGVALRRTLAAFLEKAGSLMLDLLLRNAFLPGSAGLPGSPELPGSTGLTDLAVRGDRLVTPEPDEPARETVDLAGRLVTPPLVEPHIHLDAVLTVGQPRPNYSGSLFEGIAVWAERVRDLTVEDVQARVRQVLRWQLANGVQHVRSHVDVCDPQLRALRALVELREEARGIVDLQLVAFPQQGILGYDGGEALMRKAVELGADVVGAIPHYELTREDGVESVRFAMALADEHGLRVDIHCDETDDEHSRFVEVMAAETIRRGMSGRVTASHTTAMHSYNNAYAYRLITNIARAGLHMVTNPLDNAVLQGRFDTGPIRRGHTRVKQLQEAGVNVCIGHDSVMDPWYPLGYGDPLQAAFVLVHLGQMSGDAELRRLIEMITVNPAAALGVPDYGLRVGGPADLVVFDAPSEADALRLVAPRLLVLRAGRVVARTRPAQTSVTWHGAEQEINFLR